MGATGVISTTKKDFNKLEAWSWLKALKGESQRVLYFKSKEGEEFLAKKNKKNKEKKIKKICWVLLAEGQLGLSKIENGQRTCYSLTGRRGTSEKAHLFFCLLGASYS